MDLTVIIQQIADGIALVTAFGLIISPGLLFTFIFLENESFLGRIVIGTGLGLVIYCWIILLLSYLPFGITNGSLFFSILIASILFISIGIIRFRSTRLNATFQRILRIKKERIIELSVSLLALILFIFSLIVILPVAQSRNQKGFTEFYILQGEQEIPPWRQKYSSSDLVELSLVVKSHEKNTQNFKIQIFHNNEFVKEVKLGSFAPNDQIINQIYLDLSPTTDQYYSIALLTEDSEKPYRLLHFWIPRKNLEFDTSS